MHLEIDITYLITIVKLTMLHKIGVCPKHLKDYAEISHLELNKEVLKSSVLRNIQKVVFKVVFPFLNNELLLNKLHNKTQFNSKDSFEWAKI